ncbi:MAG TPA: SDR family oxidoreductase [Planktothrix sp.]|jgi:hypothetical protein
MTTVLITGASTGIGYEFGKLFAADDYHVVITATNENRLNENAKELKDTFTVDVDVIVCDLSRSDGPAQLVSELKKRSIAVDVLVNNAGIGAYGDFSQTELTEELALLQINVVALTQLTKLLLPSMLERRQGRILNVGSTAGFVPGPGMAVYYASKAYVLSFSEALACELEGTGVTVTLLCPGPTKTEFQKRAGMETNRLFSAVKPMTALRAAKKGYLGMQRGQTIVIPGIFNKTMAASSRLFPREVIPSMVRKFNEPS